jgi:DNA modification methylase
MEQNQLICGNNVEVLRTFPDECIDLTVTSPPYDNLRDYNGYDFDFENLAKELFRVTKKGGVVVWVVGDAVINGSESGTSFKQALHFKEIGFNLHDTMIYSKTSPGLPHPNRYLASFEYMFVLSKGKPKTVNLIKDRKNNWLNHRINNSVREKDGKMYPRKGSIPKEYGVRYNIWKYNVGYLHTTKDKEAYQHPAMFPEKLAEDHIISWSNEGDLVLDPFVGSGTTAKMAKYNKRNYIGIDISQEYLDIAKKRLIQSIL